MTDEEFLAELRTELVAAAARKYRGPAAVRRAPRLLAAAAIAAACIGGVFAAQTGDVDATVEVIRIDGFVQVRLIDLENRPEDIEEAAQAADVDLTIEEVPVGPSMVGKFITLSGTEVPPELITLDEDASPDGSTSTFTGFRVPDGFDGNLRISIGRTARTGEDWVATSDARAAGEALECQDLLGATVDQLRGELDASGLAVRWFGLGATVGEISDDLDEYSNWQAVRILGAGDQSLFIEVTPDGSWPYPAEIPEPTTPPDC